MKDTPENHLVSLRHRENTKDIWYPVVFLLLWSSGFTAVKIGLEFAEPLTFLALRYACVVAVLLPVQMLFKPPVPVSVRAWIDLGVMGILVQFAYFGCMYLSMSAGMSVGALALIVSMQPILVGIASPIFVGDRVYPMQWAGLLLGFAGSAVVIMSRSRIEGTSLSGIFLAVIALLGMTSAVLYEKKTNCSNHPVVSNLVQCAVGLAMTMPLALVLEKNHLTWAPSMVAALGYLVVCNSLISISLLLAMVRRGSAARVSSLFFMVPPLATLTAYVLVDEVMLPLAWVGMGMAAVGVGIANRGKRALRAN